MIDTGRNFSSKFSNRNYLARPQRKSGMSNKMTFKILARFSLPKG